MILSFSSCQFNMLSPTGSLFSGASGIVPGLAPTSPFSPAEQKSMSEYMLEDSTEKKDLALNALPNLPKEAGEVRPTAESTTLVYLCSDGQKTLHKYSFRNGAIGTDVQTNFMVYMRNTFDYASELGRVATANGKTYMIAYQEGRQNPIFYIDMSTKPERLSDDYQRPFSVGDSEDVDQLNGAIFESNSYVKSYVGSEELREQSYELNTYAEGRAPKCGKPKDPPAAPNPTGSEFPALVDKDLKVYSAQMESFIDGSDLIAKMNEEKKCVSALQVFGNNFSTFSKLSINPVTTGTGLASNNLEGHSFRNVCNKNTVVALSGLDSTLKFTGLKSYVMKILATADADYPVDQMIISPSALFKKDLEWHELDLRSSIKLAPYIKDVASHGDFKVVTAYIPFGDLVDCDAVLAKGKELSPGYPNLTPAKSLELMGVFHTDLKYSFNFVHAEEESEGCEGGGPIKSPLIISFRGNNEVPTQEKSVKFDIDGDGAQDQVAGWPVKNARVAFLVLDAGKRKLKQKYTGKQLFGTETDLSQLGLGSKFADGHEAIAQLDINQDGKLTVADKINGVPVGSFLKLWFDNNGDAVAQAYEVIPFHSLFKGYELDLKAMSTKEVVSRGAGSITTYSELKAHKKFNLKVYDLWFQIK